MQRILSALALAGLLTLGACANTSSTTITAVLSDATALLTAAEDNGQIPASTGTLLSEIITGLGDVSAASTASITDGDSTTMTALKALDTAIGAVAADSTSETVTRDAMEAQTLLADLLSGGTTVTRAKIETAVATFLIDDLATHSAASAAPGITSNTQRLIEDARAHIAALG